MTPEERAQQLSPWIYNTVYTRSQVEKLVADAIRAAEAQARADGWRKAIRKCAEVICPGCAGDWNPAQPHRAGGYWHQSTGTNQDMWCKASLIWQSVLPIPERARLENGENNATV